jgi:serine/threonine protein kinase
MRQLKQIEIDDNVYDLVWSTRMTKVPAIIINDKIKLSLGLIKSVNDIKDAIDDIIQDSKTYISDDGKIFIKSKKIGTGGFSSVYLCSNNPYVVMKFSNGVNTNAIKREITIYKDLKKFPLIFNHVPKFFGHVSDDCLIIQRYATDLSQALSKNLLSHDDKCSIARTIISCLKSLHDVGYVHCDIKPGNIFLNSSNTSILGDLGLTRHFDENAVYIIQKKYNRIGTIRYMSRDIHNRVNPTRRSDLESFGWVLVEMFGGKLPWKSKDEAIAGVMKHNIKTVDEFVNECFEIPENSVKNYLDKVFLLEYKERPDYELLKELFQVVKKQC